MLFVLGEEQIYISSDSIDPFDTVSASNDALSSNFLNNIKVYGLPNHSRSKIEDWLSCYVA